MMCRAALHTPCRAAVLVHRAHVITQCNVLLDCICYRCAGNGVHEQMGFCGADSLFELHASCNDDYTIVWVNSVVMLLDCY